MKGPIVRVLSALKALAPFLLLFFVGASAQVTAPAQQARKIEAPSRFNRGAFVAGVSLLAASKTADATTTRQLLDRGGLENNPLFGRHRSSAKQAGINAGIHPMNFVVSADSVWFALQAFPLAFLKVEAFQKWCNAHPSSL